MGSLTDFAEQKMLDHVFNNVAYTPPATVYLALCTADPTDAATSAATQETSGTGYARAAVPFSAAASRAIANSGVVTFAQAGGVGWGTVSHWALCDNITPGSGAVLAHGAFAASKVIAAGNTPSVAAGAITVSFGAGSISNYLANIWLDKMFRNQAFAAPATHVALTTAAITDAGTGATMTEVANVGAYARKQVNANGGASPTWDLAASGEVDNTHAITLVTATASWGTVVAAAVMDGATRDLGNILFYDNAVADQAVASGDTVEFAIGDMSWFAT